jgi:hypothetical protein
MMLRQPAFRLAALLTLLAVSAALGLPEANAQAPRKGGTLGSG